ncbi:WXG100 family type VII secretion target [Mycobacterium sp. DL440]|uniref:WXG100 family type VII secretion target n=1 Tax=Mycobacterium sp. DL440 TaxID=2675523 RepID=UPI001422A1B7|nr:WXG100 family type VII secretion target [Mycobacterium sp. DL440]
MSVTISQVLASHPEQLVSAAGEVASAASDLDSRIARERMQLTRLASDWRGTASDTAQGHANEMFGDQELYRDRLKSLHTAMSSGGAELGGIRTRVSDLVSSPEADLFDISDDGRVALGWRLKLLVASLPVLALKWGMRRLALQTAIQTALSEFDAADKSTANKIDRINKGLVK